MTDGRVFIGPPGADPMSLDGFTDIGHFVTDCHLAAESEPEPRRSTGVYRPCNGCRAPIMVPFPPDWSMDLIKVGPPQGPVDSYFTPHEPGCHLTVTKDGMFRDPMACVGPGIAVNVPGRYITGLRTPFDAYIEAHRAAFEAEGDR